MQVHKRGSAQVLAQVLAEVLEQVHVNALVRKYLRKCASMQVRKYASVYVH